MVKKTVSYTQEGRQTQTYIHEDETKTDSEPPVDHLNFGLEGSKQRDKQFKITA